ncbi:MAG: hypothetical protein J6K98_06495 [Clostridia bacterium]|nr:hypothetical protein [Clostridia bacterium]
MEMIKNIVVFLRYPSEGIYRLKRRTRMWEGWLLYALTLASQLISQYVTHEPLRTVDPTQTTFLMEASKLLLPLFSWVVVSYAMSSIRDGECKIGLSFVSTAYCMLPFILLNVPLALLSQIMALGEAGIYNGLQMAMYIWIGFLFYKQVMEANNYRFGETIELILLSLCGIVICWTVVLTLYVFMSNVWTFVEEIILDIRVLLTD